ncbi:23S rRNA (cytidine(2498)-2'-O)-methyltransferase RlmM [Pigmentibacter ruber]|uniref:23S rRNA (cytidine(2498)-2'-O)-methyltransferase RlmM n=1 Tax=Pigmentibacter ruber TaxID=2683196 RepID=UPI00131B5DA5|nr:23S rRNA (cytidine(2498)-2'-O)-methyltransferase RlmM [Pigmentibacter ruber]BFD33136.1 23S rRNA (cytidine(2498)-2'-O)-methyltransferase RlmM [Pigmentibacter ruber]
MSYSLLLYCRSGFESECAAEILAYTSERSVSGFVKAKENTAHVLFQGHNPQEVIHIWNDLQLKDLIFARQIILVAPLVADLPESNRTKPIYNLFFTNFAEVLNGRHILDDLFIETFDTDSQKELLNFCKKFTSPMLSELKKNGFIINDKSQRALRMHLVFLTGQSCYIGLCAPKKASQWFMGIPRFKFPIDAPSRSTLKLEEAFHVFCNAVERESELQAGMTAVDLGASPGGWTYQFVRRNIYVFAIDNGPMQDKLMKTGLVEHLKEDGFKFRAKKPVDWLVCDMVEQPKKIAQLIADWAKFKLSKRFIFNLKLPMKKRYIEVTNCLNLIRNELDAERIHYTLQAQQLYHDREEVTVYLKILN